MITKIDDIKLSIEDEKIAIEIPSLGKVVLPKEKALEYALTTIESIAHPFSDKIIEVKIPPMGAYSISENDAFIHALDVLFKLESQYSKEETEENSLKIDERLKLWTDKLPPIINVT